MKNTDHIVQYMLENPTATVKEVSEKFMVTKKVVYNLRSYNGLSKKKPSMSVKPMVENRKDILIEKLLSDIVHRDAVIQYLENKLSKKHGLAV